MRLFILNLVFSLALINSADVDLQCRTKQEDIKDIENSLEELQSLKADLDVNILISNRINTAGNIASIAGAAFMLTPIFYVGITALGVGTVACLGSNAYNFYIEEHNNEILTQVLEREKDAEGKYDQYLVEIMSTYSKSTLLIMKISDLKRMYDVSRGYKVAYNGIYGIANAIKAGAKMNIVGTFFAGVAVVLSGADIILTWSIPSEASKQLEQIIQYKENLLIKEYQELKLLCDENN